VKAPASETDQRKIGLRLVCEAGDLPYAHPRHFWYTLQAASSFDGSALAHKAGEFRMLLKYALEYSGCQRITAFQASPMREPRHRIGKFFVSIDRAIGRVTQEALGSCQSLLSCHSVDCLLPITRLRVIAFPSPEKGAYQSEVQAFSTSHPLFGKGVSRGVRPFQTFRPLGYSPPSRNDSLWRCLGRP